MRSADMYHLQDTALPLEQRLCRVAFGDIRYRPHAFKVTRFIVCCRMTHDSNVLHRAIRHQQPMFKIESLPLPCCLIESFLDEGSVLRMGSLEYDFHCRFVDSVVFKNSKRFL